MDWNPQSPALEMSALTTAPFCLIFYLLRNFICLHYLFTAVIIISIFFIFYFITKLEPSNSLRLIVILYEEHNHARTGGL